MKIMRLKSVRSRYKLMLIKGTIAKSKWVECKYMHV